MRPRRARAAFSLLEVVLALGIFALAIIALVGLSGPLLRNLQNEQREAELEHILEATRAWVARADFAAFRGTLSGGRTQWIVFLLEPLEEGGPAGWRIGTTSELAGYLDLGDATTAVRGPSLFVLDLDPLPTPTGAADRGYLPLRAELRERPVPEPGADVATWLADTPGAGIVRTFNLVALP